MTSVKQLETYEQQVWRKAIREACDEIMRFCPSLSGGRQKGETVEQYADRGMNCLKDSLARLAFAKVQYKKVGGRNKEYL